MSSESKIPEENLVDEFSNLIQKYIDTPKVFADAVGFGLSSALLGPFFNSLWVPHGTPNLFIILSSLPGRTRRSTLQSAFERVYKRVHRTEMLGKITEDYVSEELKKEENKDCTPEEFEKNLSEEDRWKINQKVEDEIRNMIIEEGSTEGLIDHIENTDSDEFIITSREMGGVFLKMFKDGYEQGVGLLFSKMYYGEGATVYLSSRGGKKGGRKIKDGLYVTMLGGMQEFRQYITEDAIRQGLARRIIIVYVSKAKEWMPPIDERRQSFDDELDVFADKIIERRKYFRERQNSMSPTCNRKTLDIIFHPEVEKNINAFDHELALKLDASPTLENIAKQSGWEHLFKLSACYEISKVKNLRGLDKDIPHVLICPDSYERAKVFLDIVNENSKGEIDGISDIPKKTVNIRTPLERLFNLALEKGSDGITVTELLHKTHWFSEDLWKLAMELKQQGRMKMETRQGKTKKSTFFTAITEDQKAEVGDDFVVQK